MKKTIPFAAALALATLTLGCGAEGVPTEENVIANGGDLSGRASIVTGADDTCPVDHGGLDAFFAEESSLLDISYDSQGRVLSASFDDNNDSLADVACAYGYANGRLEVVSVDFAGDGVIDEYQYVLPNQRSNVEPYSRY